MTILIAALFIALVAQWIAIIKIHKNICSIRMELDKQSGAIRGLKLIFQMISNKSREKVGL